MSSDWMQYAERIRTARERLVSSRISDPALVACVAGLARVEEALRRPLQISVVGEYNSGKTSVTDLLIGQGLLPFSVVANTGVPVLVSHGREPALYGMGRDGIQVRIDNDDDPLTDLEFRAIQLALPLPWLEHFKILDTPPAATPDVFLAEADIVLWCTVATRAWTESERNVWTSLPPRFFQNAILVATHKDSIYTEEDCQQVLKRLRTLTKGLFRDAVLVSAAPTPETGKASQTQFGSGDDATVLRTAVEAAADAIMARRTDKAIRIVRRLSRLAFQEFGRAAVVPEAELILARWARDARVLAERVASGQILPRFAVEELLRSFAERAEELRSGAIRTTDPGSTRVDSGLQSREWPADPKASAHFARQLAADLAGVLRMLAGSSKYEDPSVRKEREVVRATLLALSDLSDSILGLQRMLQLPRLPQIAAQ